MVVAAVALPVVSAVRHTARPSLRAAHEGAGESARALRPPHSQAAGRDVQSDGSAAHDNSVSVPALKMQRKIRMTQRRACAVHHTTNSMQRLQRPRERTGTAGLLHWHSQPHTHARARTHTHTVTRTHTHTLRSGIEKDGNCQFRAFAHSLFDDEERHHEVTFVAGPYSLSALFAECCGQLTNEC